jgi:hypothetical protein
MVAEDERDCAHDSRGRGDTNGEEIMCPAEGGARWGLLMRPRAAWGNLRGEKIIF